MVRTTDGRSVGRSVYVHVITKCSGMGRFTKLWGSDYARALRARVDLRYDANESTRRLVEDGMSTRLTNKHTARGFSILYDVFAQKQCISVLQYVIKDTLITICYMDSKFFLPWNFRARLY